LRDLIFEADDANGSEGEIAFVTRRIFISDFESEDGGRNLLGTIIYTVDWHSVQKPHTG
jgi:hypothetical protein